MSSIHTLAAPGKKEEAVPEPVYVDVSCNAYIMVQGNSPWLGWVGG